MKRPPTKKSKKAKRSHQDQPCWAALRFPPLPARVMTRCLPYFKENEV